MYKILQVAAVLSLLFLPLMMKVKRQETQRQVLLKLETGISLFAASEKCLITVADPGFLVGGTDLVEGFLLPRQLRFENCVCQNVRIWTLRGHAPVMSPESANALSFTHKLSRKTACPEFVKSAESAISTDLNSMDSTRNKRPPLTPLFSMGIQWHPWLWQVLSLSQVCAWLSPLEDSV